MSRKCQICGKGPKSGSTIKRRGLAKKKGGVGRRITGVSKKFFSPNLQRVRALVDGKKQTLRVCTECIKSGKVQKV